VALAPDYTAAWHELGTLLRSFGRFDEALMCFRRTVDLDPDWPEAYRSLAVTGQQADEAQLRRLAAVLKDRERSVSDRISAGFALGTLLDNAERCDEAFPCFAEANALHRQQRAEAGERFDIEALRRQVDDLIELATPDFFSAVASWGNPSQAPVFIVGMPRSGTSLVEQIAASHSRVFGAGELDALREIWDTLSAHNRGRPVEKWGAAFARRLADRHVGSLQTLGNGAVRVIDKMPDNIFFLWLIAALFPSARIILCRRDLRDVCLSCYFQHFTEGHLYAYDLADCGARAFEIDRLATHWSRVVPLEILAIDYEKLVSDLEGESRRLIEFLGLEWEPACLDFHLTERPVLTASASQVRQPLYTRSVGRWRRYQGQLKPLLEVLQAGIIGTALCRQASDSLAE
jgi:tetratricopeptide (TPR) repeat protein